MKLAILIVALQVHGIAFGGFNNIASSHSVSFERCTKTKKIGEARKKCGIRAKNIEGHLISHYGNSKSRQGIRNKFKRSSRLDAGSEEIELTNIFPVTPSGVSAIRCVKLPSGIVSCQQNELQYNIKLQQKDMTNDNVNILLKALFSKLASASQRQWKRDNFILTIPPQLQKPPQFIVLPATTTGDSCEQHETTEETIETCKECIKSVESERCKPMDFPFLIECCPADFEPRSIDQEENCLGEDPLKTSKRPSAFIYSCKWQGKRQVNNELIFFHKDRPVFKILIDPREIAEESIPIKVFFKD